MALTSAVTGDGGVVLRQNSEVLAKVQTSLAGKLKDNLPVGANVAVLDVYVRGIRKACIDAVAQIHLLHVEVAHIEVEPQSGMISLFH